MVDASASYDRSFNAASTASRNRVDTFHNNSDDVADELADIRTEETGVQDLQLLSEKKAEAARMVASAFANVYGDAKTSALLSDISVAEEDEATGLSDWHRAAEDINTLLTGVVNGRLAPVNDDTGALFKSADDSSARSRARWESIASRIVSLRDQLDADLASAQGNSPSATALERPQDALKASQPATAVATPAPAAVPDDTSATASLAAQRAIRDFYAAVSHRRYSSAYALLSPSYKRTVSMSNFASGYRTTESVVATTMPTADQDLIAVDLVAQDRKPGTDVPISTRYRGTWRVVWSVDKQRWLLDDGQFTKL